MRRRILAPQASRSARRSCYCSCGSGLPLDTLGYAGPRTGATTRSASPCPARFARASGALSCLAVWARSCPADLRVGGASLCQLDSGGMLGAWRGATTSPAVEGFPLSAPSPVGLAPQGGGYAGEHQWATRSSRRREQVLART